MSDQADADLAPEQFPALNRTFYEGASPTAYLRQRLHLLLLALGRGEALKDLLAQGVEFEKLKMSVTAEPGDDFEKEERPFASTETIVLVHHSAEALLRLLFAHEGHPPCPWLELARLRRPSQFKERVAALNPLGDSDQCDRFLEVVYGYTSCSSDVSEPPTAAQWEEATTSAMEFLTLVAQRLLSEASTYNAAKHGMSVVSQTGSIHFGSDDDPFPIDLGTGHGPMLTCLDRQAKNGDQPARWIKSSTWVRMQEDLVFIYLVLQMIDNIWSVANVRYLGDGGPIKFFSAKQIEASQFRRPDTPYLIQSVGEQLLYYIPTEGPLG